MLPINTNKFTFDIDPPGYIAHTIEGLCFGVMYLMGFAEFIVKENTNHIIIEMPSMDNSFFERYYVKDEFARVVNDTIYWKGEVFVKRK